MLKFSLCNWTRIYGCRKGDKTMSQRHKALITLAVLTLLMVVAGAPVHAQDITVPVAREQRQAPASSSPHSVAVAPAPPSSQDSRSFLERMKSIFSGTEPVRDGKAPPQNAGPAERQNQDQNVAVTPPRAQPYHPSTTLAPSPDEPPQNAIQDRDYGPNKEISVRSFTTSGKANRDNATQSLLARTPKVKMDSIGNGGKRTPQGKITLQSEAPQWSEDDLAMIGKRIGWPPAEVSRHCMATYTGTIQTDQDEFYFNQPMGLNLDRGATGRLTSVSLRPQITCDVTQRPERGGLVQKVDDKYYVIPMMVRSSTCDIPNTVNGSYVTITAVYKGDGDVECVVK